MAGIVVKKGEYENLNLKNLNPKHSVVLTVKSNRDFENKYGESTLFNFFVHRVLDEEGAVYEEVDKDASTFINHKTKYTQDLLEFFRDNEDNTVMVTLDRIEPRVYNVPNKSGGTMEKTVYTPVYTMQLLDTTETPKAESSDSTPSLPMPKGVFIQLAKSTGVEHDGVMNVQGKDYKVSDYVTQDEYSG